MDAQFFYHLQPLHCGGVHLSDQMMVNLAVLTVVSLVIIALALGSSRRASDSGES